MAKKMHHWVVDVQYVVTRSVQVDAPTMAAARRAAIADIGKEPAVVQDRFAYAIYNGEDNTMVDRYEIIRVIDDGETE